MSSLALYRKYRSQTFEEVLGQEHVTETLQAGIREGRIGHAYLFSGSRGTGKTSTARILAKALNCEQGPTPTPCNKCEACVSITEGHSLDVIEIDAASHGGVDDVRELRENALLAPAIARSKIYIVDEAHMVSTQGWNAFLKTVEEPPEHVIFVFATTEPHKVLPTIVSRCQRFDFRRVSSQTIAEHLGRVAKEERIEADEAALQLIARAAEGGVRDALSTLDQLAAAGTVTAADAARLLGASSIDALFELCEAVADGDTGASILQVARLVEGGQDLRTFARNMLEHLRALLITKQVADPGDLIDANDETRARLAAQADRFGGGRLVHVIKLLVEALAAMRDQTSPRLALELAVVRATMPEVDETASAAVARIERLERIVGVSGAAPAGVAEAAPSTPYVPPAEPAPAAPAPKARKGKAEAPATTPPAVVEEPAAVVPMAGGLDLDALRGSWSVVLEEVRKQKKTLHALLADATLGGLDGNVLTLELRYAIHAKMVTEPAHSAIIAKAVHSVFGTSPRIAAAVKEQIAAIEEPDEIDEARGSEPAADPLDIVRQGFGDVVIEE
jgi:DNA polymerase III subunit gamma/tau